MIGKASEHYYDPQFRARITVIKPGSYAIGDSNKDLHVAELGSSVGVCLFDSEKEIGGLCHFILDTTSTDLTSPENRFAINTIECLVNEMLRFGGHRKSIEASIFGGASLLGSDEEFEIRLQNFVKTYLESEGIQVVAEDMGGNLIRKIHLWPSTGRLMRRLIEPTLRKSWEFESRQVENLIRNENYGSIEIF